MKENNDIQNKNKKNTADDTDNKEKRKLLLWGAVLIAMLVLLGFVIARSGGDTDNNEQNADETESTTVIQTPSNEGESGNNDIETIITQSEEPPLDMDEYGPGNGTMFSPGTTENYNTDENRVQYTPKYLPTPGPVDNPIDNRKDADLYGGDISADNPAEAPTYLLVRTYIGNMMNIDINENSGYRQSFSDTINKYGTENAKRYGFRPWWISGPEHTQEWNLLASQGGYSIQNTFRVNDESYIANDTIRYSVTAMPRLKGNGGETRMQNIDIDMYLKYVDGKWLLDAYQFKDGYPQLR